MARLGPYLCLGGYEVGNYERSAAYAACLGLDHCACPALDDDYSDITEAPWYDADHPESANFYGFLPKTIELSSAASRPVTPTLGEGSTIGAERLPGRVVEVVGWMLALDAPAMYWGERWLTEALRGRMCKGNCAGDELNLLAFCRGGGHGGGPPPTLGTDCYEDVYEDVYGGPCAEVDPAVYEADFRSLVASALVDGPRFSELSGDDCLLIGEAQFQFASKMPYLYHPPETVVNSAVVFAETSLCEIVTTPDWFDGSALVFDVVVGDGGLPAPGLTISITFSLDGTCPEDRVAPSVVYTIPELEPNARITIDGTRRTVTYYNPTSKRAEPGFDRISYEGQFCWPILPACSSVCVCMDNASSADVVWEAQSYQRDL